MKLVVKTKIVLLALLGSILVLALACGGAAAPAAAPSSTEPETAKVSEPATVASAKDDIILVVPEEPIALGSRHSIGAALNAAITRANLQDPLTWQSGDDLRIVPTSGTVGWKQIDQDTWQFQLREGVKFHNGEAWNADAALYSFASEGNPSSGGGSINYTGAYTAEKVDDFTVNLNCEEACPIFPNTSFFLNFEAPEWHANNSEDVTIRESVGFGPYKHVSWDAGVSIKQEAYEDYVPVGDHFEFQKPTIKNITWLWRNEPTVIAAMVKAGEADMGWDIGIDGIGSLSPDQLRFGSSAESYSLTTDTVWHPEMKKKKVRQAMVHAINCQELVEELYSGYTTCRGNIIWPGIIGASERNTAPYKYDPTLSKQLLSEAGYDPKNTITIMSRGARVPKQVEVAEALVGYWKEVGISAELNIVEPSIRSSMSKCAVGKAVQEVVAASGRDPDKDEITKADMDAALAKGGADCPHADLTGNQPSNETLDFGRQVRYYMSCLGIRSLICDTSPGGIQDQVVPALEASGEERQRLLEVLADTFHDDVLFIPLFDLPMIYAADPKLLWEPRLDPAIRVSSMRFSD